MLTYVFNIPLAVVCWDLFGCGFAAVRVAFVLVLLCGAQAWTCLLVFNGV